MLEKGCRSPTPQSKESNNDRNSPQYSVPIATNPTEYSAKYPDSFSTFRVVAIWIDTNESTNLREVVPG
jgi:hypothetical protein